MFFIDPYKLNHNEISFEFLQNAKDTMKSLSCFPAIASDNVGGAKSINEFYQQDTLNQQLYIVEQILKPSMEDFTSGHQVRYEWKSNYEVTYNKAPILSLYSDRYQYTGGAHGITVRKSENWNVPKGELIPLKSFFPEYDHYEIHVKDEILRQISESEKENVYFTNYPQLVHENFKSENYYIQLEPMAIVIYFQQYEIAPYVSGIPTFAIPIT